jgi:hypothetical protein
VVHASVFTRRAGVRVAAKKGKKAKKGKAKKKK